MAADFEHVAVGEHDLERFDVSAGRAVFPPVAAGRVDRHDASHRGHVAHRRVGAEHQALGGEKAIERRQHHAGLHPHALAVDRQDAAEIAREIDDDPAAERLARQARARAARINRDIVLCRVLRPWRRRLERSRPHHAERTQLVNAGVGRIELRVEVVAADFASQHAPQVFFDSLVLWVHR